MRRITGLDWPLLTLAACLLALSAAGALVVSGFDDPKVGVVMLLQCIPYALATWLVVRGRAERAVSGRALASILLVGVAMRCLLLPGTPVSNDLFRYIWDGRVQAAGINPYLYVPTDAALSALRDAAIYPFINRADYAPTIYPPTSQIVFYLVTRISEAPIAMKAAMVAFEGLAVWAMLQLLALRGLPRSRILLYAWHPLPLWEFARSGHVDIVAIAFLLLAFLASERGSPLLAGVAFGAGVVAKFFPVVTGPALYKRWDWRLPIAFAVTIVSQLAYYTTYYCAGASLHQSNARTPSLFDILSIMPLVNTFTAVPISFGGVGVRETLFQRLLGHLSGVPEPIAVLTASLGFTIQAMCGLVGGAIYLFWRPRRA